MLSWTEQVSWKQGKLNPENASFFFCPVSIQKCYYFFHSWSASRQNRVFIHLWPKKWENNRQHSQGKLFFLQVLPLSFPLLAMRQVPFTFQFHAFHTSIFIPSLFRILFHQFSFLTMPLFHPSPTLSTAVCWISRSADASADLFDNETPTIHRQLQICSCCVYMCYLAGKGGPKNMFSTRLNRTIICKEIRIMKKGTSFALLNKSSPLFHHWQ